MPDSAFPSPSSQKAAPEDAPSPAAQEIRDRGSFLFPFEQSILDLFKGDLSISQISNELSKRYGETYKKEEFLNFCNELISEELLIIHE